MRKPTVVLLATGGTIASVATSSVDEHYGLANMPVAALVQSIPELAELANIEYEQIAQVSSQFMTEPIWCQLALRINELLATEQVAGIVVTHGTDTIEETAFFCNLLVKSQKPVVFTGAMRPANALSADGARNLYKAIVVASANQSQGRGVLLTFNDCIYSARDTTKTNVHRLESFSSTEFGILGYVQGDVPFYFRQLTSRHTFTSEFAGLSIYQLPDVQIIYSYVGNRRSLVDAMVRDGARGIVSAGMGKGNQSEDVLLALAEARREGVMIVKASRVRSGIVSRDPALDDTYDFIAANAHSPQHARILLALALTQTNSTAQIQRMFDEY